MLIRNNKKFGTLPAAVCSVIRHPDTNEIIGLRGYCKKQDIVKHWDEIVQSWGLGKIKEIKEETPVTKPTQEETKPQPPEPPAGDENAQ